MSLRCLRPDLPPASSFTVAELPHYAKLDQNEAPVDLPAELKRELVAELAQRPWNRYPQPAQYVEAKRKLAAVIGVDPDSLCLTVGCDQAILAAFHVAGGPGRRARWFEPTYPYIPLAARLTHTSGEGVALGVDVDTAIDAAAIVAEPAPDLVVLVAPNNPTGGSPCAEAVDAAIDDEGRLVFIDEAYADFSGETRIPDVEHHPNLVIGRSLSKALLADIRLGFVVAHPEIIGALEQLFTAPYHLNALQLVVAGRYADIAPHVAASVAAVVTERQRVTDALAAVHDIEPVPSRANFVLFRVAGDRQRSHAVYETLAKSGVRIRDVGGLPGLASYLRVTIGTKRDNAAFLAALGEALRGEV